jgi:hypothetical protein
MSYMVLNATKWYPHIEKEVAGNLPHHSCTGGADGRVLANNKWRGFIRSQKNRVAGLLFRDRTFGFNLAGMCDYVRGRSMCRS